MHNFSLILQTLRLHSMSHFLVGIFLTTPSRIFTWCNFWIAWRHNMHRLRRSMKFRKARQILSRKILKFITTSLLVFLIPQRQLLTFTFIFYSVYELISNVSHMRRIFSTRFVNTIMFYLLICARFWCFVFKNDKLKSN